VNIKVGSADSGLLFGNLEYDSPNGAEKRLLPLANIRMDIMDYIVPATCGERAFRAMWAEFEWENKIAVNTEISDLNTFLDHLLDITNMTCQVHRPYRNELSDVSQIPLCLPLSLYVCVSVCLFVFVYLITYIFLYCVCVFVCICSGEKRKGEKRNRDRKENIISNSINCLPCLLSHPTCLKTPRDYLDKGSDSKGGDSSNFLAANLYSKSMFGECALLNVSVEKNPVKGKHSFILSPTFFSLHSLFVSL